MSHMISVRVPKTRELLRKFQADQDQRIAQGEHLRTVDEYVQSQVLEQMLVEHQAQRYGRRTGVR